MTTQNMKFGSSICVCLLLICSSAFAQPAPSEVVSSSTGPISGYMDFHFNQGEAEDGVLDFHRFVLIVNHSFSPRIRFVAELELEHAFVEGLEESGELELEQAYVDFLLTRSFNVRAGMLLVPMGIINERHEPPVFQGVERPFVDTVIIPTTWFENGAGMFGEVGRGFRYRAYVMAPLNALEFSAEEGIRNGRQKGSRSDVRNVAYTGRVEYVGVPGLTLGASAWSGKSSFLAPRLDVQVRVGEADVRYKRNRLELRGEFAQVSIDDAERLNLTVGQLTGVSPNIARTLRGFYAEGAYRVWQRGAGKDVVGFARYENFDTQFRMPSGYIPLKQFDRDAWIAGAAYYPDPDIAVKVDYVWQRSLSSVIIAPNGFNIGIGWWF
jgi:Phosphate-selective porin O and P